MGALSALRRGETRAMTISEVRWDVIDIEHFADVRARPLRSDATQVARSGTAHGWVVTTRAGARANYP